MRLYVLTSAKHEHIQGGLCLGLLLLVLALAPTPLAATPITYPCGTVCDWVEVDVPIDPPQVNPGWPPTWTLAEIAEAQRLDDLHEPERQTMWAWVCTLVDKLPPWVPQPKTPETPQVPGGGSGGGESGGGTSIPEPTLLVLVGSGLLVGGRRWRRR